MCVGAPHVSGTLRGQKRALDALETGATDGSEPLDTGAGNRTWVSYESSERV